VSELAVTNAAPPRKYGSGTIRERGGKFSIVFWKAGKQHERRLVAKDHGSAVVEAHEFRETLLYGNAPASGVRALTSLCALVSPDLPGVYAILDERGFVKIGKAQNIRKRIAQLQGANPRPIRLVAVLSNRTAMESHFLYKLKKSGWVRGEWFAPSPQVVAEIRAARGRF